MDWKLFPRNSPFPPNYYVWFRRVYKNNPEETLREFAVPIDVIKELEDFREVSNETSIQTTFLWRNFSGEFKNTLKERYLLERKLHKYGGDFFTIVNMGRLHGSDAEICRLPPEITVMIENMRFT